MKKQIITTILLILWAGLFSQEFRNPSIWQENTQGIPDRNTSNLTGNNAAIKSFNPSVFQEFLADWANTNHVPGMSVNILKKGQVYWKYHYGFANIAENKPVTDSTAFLLCSISKLITQTAAMQLWEQGDFELDDDINDYLPFEMYNPTFPDSIITFYHLMTHTSSIKDYWVILNQLAVWGQDSPIPLGEFLEGYLVEDGSYYNSNNWYIYPPGGWNYSNVGSALLGYLVEVISGQDFDAYCQEHIFDPLGIENASFFLANMDTSLLATPYSWSGTSFIPHLQLGWPPYPAGLLKMSAQDLSKFLGMYMNHGTYNGNILLNPETIELITTPLFNTVYGQQCLSWFYDETLGSTYWGGIWTNPPISSTGIEYHKNDQWGSIFLLNTMVNQQGELGYSLDYFAMQYDAFSVETISMTDADGDQLIEPNEEFQLGFKFRNNTNITEIAENTTVTLSFESPYLTLTSDSTVELGTLNYLDEIQLPVDQFVFEVGSTLPRGNIEFQLHFTWNDGKEYTTTFNLFGGLADVLLVRDEASSMIQTQDWYLKSLDSLGYIYQYYDPEVMGDPIPEMISNIPAVIWFTGSDAENTISENNQLLLEGYLDSGGQLFMSGQNISDELAGTSFLESYLHVEHIEDNTNSSYIIGIENDPIGNGEQYQLNTGDALANQFSKSVVGPLTNAEIVFKYVTTGIKGAAIRYEDATYKTVFFAFGFEAINGFENRTEILFRILNDYFQVIVGDEDQLMSETNGTSINVYPNPLGQSSLIEYTLSKNSPVTLKIIDLSGREMATLVNEVQQKGEQRVVFNTLGLKAGIYFCVLKTSEGVQTKKMIKL
ncbi:MAG: serine hydrolase [Bacteroidales bacterium]|nr:serine hydrolase [Bacteroidales bacterium]